MENLQKHLSELNDLRISIRKTQNLNSESTFLSSEESQILLNLYCNIKELQMKYAHIRNTSIININY